MANMSYCRFSNTLDDLSDCNDALCDDQFESLSEGEQKACRKLYRLCQQFIETYESDMTTPEYRDAP